MRPRNKPLVLLLTTDLERGGLPLRMARLAKALPDQGFTPVVGCLTRPGPLSSELQSAGIDCFACEGLGGWDFRCLQRLAQNICRLNPDLIHASLLHANLAARLVGRLDRPRPLITSTVTIEIERPLHRWIEALTWQLSDMHVANSDAVAAHLVDDLGFDPDRLSVIPNALDLDAARSAVPVHRGDFGIASDALLLLWAGRMDPVKGLPTLVLAVKQIRTIRKVKLVLLGDGPQRREIESLIRSHELKGCIKTPGWSHEVLRWYKAADALVMPSLTEGSSNVVLEAMACGCPVLASDIPGMRELIGNNERGGLCEIGQPTDLANAILRFAGADRRDERATKAAGEFVESRHSSNRIFTQWGTLYRRVLGL